jgi:hypothetical protein
MWHVWEQEWCIQAFGGGDMRERDHLKDLGVDGEKYLKRV